MNKILSFASLVITAIAATAQTISPTATTKVYELGKFGDGVIDVFYTADTAGLKFPTQEMWEEAGFDMATINFVRSHVAKRDILDRSTRLITDTYEKRNLWMNLPIGVGKDQGGYPSSNFSDDTFSAWNYTNMFGSWNHGLFHASAVTGDAGHKNGTDVLAGIKFFESWTAGSGASGWVSKVQEKDANGYGGYAYVRPLVNACMYFGKDGINYNFEDTGYDNCKEFHRQCYKYAAECGMKDFHVGLYTAASSLTASNTATLLGTKEDGQCYDTFLNYASSNFASAYTIKTSVQNAESVYGSTEDVYQGAWIVSMARSWKNLSQYEENKRMGIVLWGEHSQSRFYSYNQGIDGHEFQENYQLLMDRFMSGGYRNPAFRPIENNDAQWADGLKDFQGICHYIPERSALKQNLPFTTYFSTGSGDRYNYKGKKTLGSWYNLGQQDVVPTYRWLVYEAGTQTPVADKSKHGVGNNGVPYFTNRDAWIGGSCLKLANEQAVDIILYRSELTMTGSNPTATIAQKRVAGPCEGTVKVIVKLKGQTEYREVAEFSLLTGTAWQSQTVALTGLQTGDVIEYLGIRTTGNTKDLMLGQLTLMDDSNVKPAEVKDAVAEVVEECQKSLSVKLTWDVEGETDAWGMLTNEKANVDHFEILYKDGEKGAAYEVGRTSAWSAYIGNIDLKPETLNSGTIDPWVGVRAASVDGKTYSKTQWVHVTRADASTLPESLSANGNYPAIILDNSSDGLEKALTLRYVDKVEVSGSDADFTYINNDGTPYDREMRAAGFDPMLKMESESSWPEGFAAADKNADKTNYILAENVLKVHQGQEITLKVKYYTHPTYTSSMKSCTLFGYADWDCSEGFNASNDEWVIKCGESNSKQNNAYLVANNPAEFTVKVPEDAVVGNSRLRLVFSDAWFPHPGAAGVTQKGFALDFPMQITGTNPGRQAEVDTHDQGDAESVDVGSETGVATVAADADRIWVYDVEGRLVAFLRNGGDVDLVDRHGTFIVRVRKGNVIRTRKVIL